ncbi:MAG: CHAP domain-containing protein [Clostridiales bacterium]|nr:CHAP domain-containing protein [Clostridiales bacterium]
MTESELRSKVANWLVQYIGITEGSAGHKAILSTFNLSGLCTRYTMTVNDAWCATAVSAAFIACDLADIFPCVECSCAEMIALAKKAGIWVENDAYVPSVGDVIMYDWQDSGSGDNTGTPDHVGVVYSISGSTMKIIEGNKSDTVGYRSMAVNGTYIRGYITPDYASAATEEIKSGWVEESDGWRYYLGNTGECVKNDWYEDEGKWYWFDGSGLMVTNVWYLYHDNWYYLGADGAMVKGQLTADGKWYIMDDDGAMITGPVTLTPDDNGALIYDGLAD